MELADRTVFDWLEEADKKGRAVKESEILKILKDTALGLQEMH